MTIKIISALATVAWLAILLEFGIELYSKSGRKSGNNPNDVFIP